MMTEPSGGSVLGASVLTVSLVEAVSSNSHTLATWTVLATSDLPADWTASLVIF